MRRASCELFHNNHKNIFKPELFADHLEHFTASTQSFSIKINNHNITEVTKDRLSPTKEKITLLLDNIFASSMSLMHARHPFLHSLTKALRPLE